MIAMREFNGQSVAEMEQPGSEEKKWSGTRVKELLLGRLEFDFLVLKMPREITPKVELSIFGMRARLHN